MQVTKVMQILTDTNIGGAGIWMCNFLESTIREKYEISVVLPKNAVITPRIKALGVKVTELNHIADTSFSFRSIGSFVKVIKEEKPDIIHTHASLSARIAAKICAVPTVHTRHCIEGKKSFPKSTVYRIINNALSSYVIGVSEAVAQNLRDDGIKEHKLSVVYNGINPLKSYTPDQKKEAKKHFGIPEDKITIGIVSRLEEVKNPLLFVRAAKIVAKKLPDVHFLIVGEGSLKNAVADALSPISDRVSLAGYVENVAMAYNAMDILALTSQSEALSISVLEGQSTGLAVISTNSGGPSEIITQDKNGIITPLNDEAALSDAMIYLVQNPDICKEMGRQGAKIVSEKFGLDKMAESIDKIYKAVICDVKKG